MQIELQRGQRVRLTGSLMMNEWWQLSQWKSRLLLRCHSKLFTRESSLHHRIAIRMIHRRK